MRKKADNKKIKKDVKIKESESVCVNLGLVGIWRKTEQELIIIRKIRREINKKNCNFKERKRKERIKMI